MHLCPCRSQPRTETLFFNFLALKSKPSLVSRPDLGDLSCGILLFLASFP